MSTGQLVGTVADICLLPAVGVLDSVSLEWGYTSRSESEKQQFKEENVMITRLVVKNFKSLRSVDLKLGALNLLTGPNMGGKSNIIDALRFLWQMFFPAPGTEGLQHAIAQRGGAGEVHWKGDDDSLVSFLLEATAEGHPDGRWIYELEIISGPGGFVQIQKESLRLHEGTRSVDLIVEENRSRWLTNSDGNKIVSVSNYGRSILQNAPENWVGYPFVAPIQSWRFYELVPQLMKQANPTTGGLILDPFGQNLSAWLMGLQTRFPESFKRIAEVATDALPNLQGLLTWPTQQGTVHLASTENGLKRPVNVWQMSNGELIFIAILSLIYTPPELGAALFCLEEPENHLHPRLLTILMTIFRQVRQEIAKTVGLAQIILTTQSPYVVDLMEIEEVTWVEKKNGATRLVRPSDHADLRKLVEDKELGLGDVVYSGLLAETR